MSNTNTNNNNNNNNNGNNGDGYGGGGGNNNNNNNNNNDSNCGGVVSGVTGCGLLVSNSNTNNNNSETLSHHDPFAMLRVQAMIRDTALRAFGMLSMHMS